MQNYLCFFLLLSFYTLSFGQKKQLEAAAVSQPFERLYLHTDHNEYRPGQFIFFKAYMTDGGLNMCEGPSNYLFVQLLNPKGKQVAQSTLFCSQTGLSNAVFIPQNESGGVFTLRAFTEQMDESGGEGVFEKEIIVRKSVRPKMQLRLELERNQYQAGETVHAKLNAEAMDNSPIASHDCEMKLFFDGKLAAEKLVRTDAEGVSNFSVDLPWKLPNSDGLLQITVTHKGITESVAKPVPVSKGNISIQFFPEGGDLIFGQKSRVAFEATDENGIPVDCRGTFFNAQEEELFSFESLHKGMGVFEVSPKDIRGAYVKLEGEKKRFPMKARFASYGIRVTPQEREGEYVEVKTFKPVLADCQLVLRSGDEVVWEKKLDGWKYEDALNVPVKNLRTGLATLTLFDEMGRPQAERLFFVNAHRQLKIETKTDKEEYLPGDLVKVKLSVKDELGNPVNGDFSANVVDDAEWSQAEDKQADIRSGLLLTTEIKGHVKEPKFYFDEEEPEEKRRQALDLLLMTHGWRRFNWEDVFSKTKSEWEELAKAKSKPAAISGYAYVVQGNYREGIEVYVPGTDHKTTTDQYGKFNLDVTGLKFPITLRARFKKRFSREIECQLPNVSSLPQPRYTLPTGLELSIQEVIDLEGEAIALTEKEVESVDEGEDNSIRGSRANATNYYLDGVRVFGSMIPKQDIEQLQAVSSGVEVRYGAQLSEVVVSGYSVRNEKACIGYSVSTLDGNQSLYEDSPLGDDFYIGSMKREQGFQIALYQYNPYYNPQSSFRQFYNPRRTSPLQIGYPSQRAVFWQPNVQVVNGKGKFQFFADPQEGTYRIIVEGIGKRGTKGNTKVGHGEATIATLKPLSVSLRLPEVVTFGDTIQAEVNIFNRTASLQPCQLLVQSQAYPSGQLDTLLFDEALQMPADSMSTIRVALPAGQEKGIRTIYAILTAQPQGDYDSKKMEVKAKGFPKELYISGQDTMRRFQFFVEKHLPGSLEATLSAFPTLLSQMDKGLASILRTPHGCFEQVSSSNYPNIMALQVLNGSEVMDLDFRKKTLGMLEVGYGKLSGYEAPGGGFSLYGRSKGVVRLTAYGLLQLHDMQAVFEGVNEKLLNRSRKWLMSQRNSSQFTEGDLTHLFTLYALGEMGHLPKSESSGEFRQFTQTDLSLFDEEMKTSEDVYRLAMLACANLNVGRPIGFEQVERLRKILKQQPPGKIKVTPTFALSYGRSFQVEATAWAALAFLKAGEKESSEVMALLNFLHEKRDGRGGFGSTQGTVMALKAMRLFYDQESSKLTEGQIIVELNGSFDTLNYSPQSRNLLHLDLSEKFKTGQNDITFRQMTDGTPIPFTIEANWRSTELPPKKELPLSMITQISASDTKASDFVRMDITLRNETESEVNAPLAIIGLPAGLSLQNWQIRELYDRKVFDHFEIKDNRLVVYYEKMEASDERTFHLDLKADLSGRYAAPASVIYPYYSEEEKWWVAGEKVLIK